MKKIGGNIDLVLKRKDGYIKNEIGEQIPKYIDYKTFRGFLDMANTNTSHSTYSAKIEESTHYFICDYEELPDFVDADGITRKATINELKAYCNNKEFDVLWLDNPMELNYQYEIYLEYKGA